VEDITKIAKASVLLPPGLIINGKLKVSGKVPGKEEVKRYIAEER